MDMSNNNYYRATFYLGKLINLLNNLFYYKTEFLKMEIIFFLKYSIQIEILYPDKIFLSR